jgi:hypothetical protein
VPIPGTGEQRNSQRIAGEKIAASRGIAADVRTEKSIYCRHAEVVFAELVPEAGTVALLGAGLG